MGIYGRAAVNAARTVANEINNDIESAWYDALCKETESESSRKKGCPKNAFFALCEEGKVKGIKKGHYCNSKDNKRYALKALKLLNDDPNLSKNKTQLWNKVMDSEIEYHSENGQLDVVISLWSNGLLKQM